jgi:hypothetical protein
MMPPGPYQLHAPELVDRGYDTTPVAGKKPKLAKWSRRPDTARDYESHGDANVGVLCGGNYNLIAIDVDVSNPFASNKLLELALEILGNAPRRAGISGATSHSGRRTGLTNLAERGVGVRTLMALAGHSNMATTQRYIDLRPAMLKAAVELV